MQDYPQFITPEEVDQILAQLEPALPSPDSELSSDLLGRVLAEDLYLDQDYPPFATVRMDGIAIADYPENVQYGQSWPIAARYFAGDLVQDIPTSKCVEIMTGAIAPYNASAVIPYEQLQIVENSAIYVGKEPLRTRQNIHAQGKDGRQGQLILAQGTQLRPEHLHTLASIGALRVRVRTMPTIALLATGDELVAPDAQLSSGKIRASNLYALETLLNWERFPVKTYYLPDDPDGLVEFLTQTSLEYPIIISTGSCSAGRSDYLPQILKQIHATILFHKVRQRPGKPMLLASLARKRILFALPGNPNSSLIGYYRYVLPFLRQHYLGIKPETRYAILGGDFKFELALSYFLPVSSYWDGARLMVKAVPNHGSGDFLSLISAQGFVSLPAEQNEFKAGSKFRYFAF